MLVKRLENHNTSCPSLFVTLATTKKSVLGLASLPPGEKPDENKVSASNQKYFPFQYG